MKIRHVHTPIDREVFDSFPLPKEDLMLADNGKFLPANHTDVSMSSLFDKPLLIHERYENAIISLCKEYGFAPHIFCKSDDIFPLPYWAAEGLGIAILPRSSIHLASSEKLYFHHIENLPLTTTGVIIHAKRYALSRIAQNFIQFWETRQEGHGHST
ncbi:LysR family transcriptional regulator substrate-binding protein [Selenomonas ruminantium]|uniref:LysR family transcriptional regulator substrate-binding protein n=1 Tax=Selenomonas ruminantium TaxID=971 RepID=UPI0026ED7271|nr:LysR family transcriptional regulator substrate-binding protein [Selenomonas ruminantium]